MRIKRRETEPKGHWVRKIPVGEKPHKCELPDTTGVARGSEWACWCGRIWEVEDPEVGPTWRGTARRLTEAM